MFTSNTSNTNIIRPIFDNQNEAIQILNPQFRVPKINDDSNNTPTFKPCTLMKNF